MRKLIFICLLIFSISASGAKSNIDSLLKLADKSNDTTKVNIYNKIASEYSFTDPAKALTYGKKAYVLSLSNLFDSGSATALKTMASVYNEIGNYTKAFDYAIKAEKLYISLKDSYGLAKTFNLIGIINDNIGNSEKAIEYYKKAFLLFEKIKDAKGQAGSLNNIAIIYFKKNKLNDAIKYIERALKIYTEAGNQRGISVCYNNMGNAYKSMKNYKLALEYYEKALKIKEEIGEPAGIGLTLINIGGIHSVNKDFSKAILYLNKSIEINKTISANSELSDAYIALSEVYSQQNNYSKAYEYMVEYSRLKDSLNSQENIKKTNELQLRYESEAKENEIELLTQKDEVNSLKIEKQNLLRNILIVGLLLFFVISFMIFARYKRIKFTNNVLEEQKQRIAKTNNELVALNEDLTQQKKIVDELNAELNSTNIKLIESERSLIELNATKDKFFSIVSHDLRNPFASIISFSRIIKRDITNFSKEEIQQLADELDKSVNKINNLLENLLWWSRLQTGKINPKPDDIRIIDVIQENIDLMQATAVQKDISIELEIDPELSVNGDWNMLSTIIRNLISNAIKFSHSNSSIKVSSSTDDQYATIIVSDNGVGISADNIERLFKIESGFTTYGTNDEKGSGLGLILCKEFVEMQDGELSIQSTQNVGTSVSFTIPLSV